jgi:hypothetical protein
MPSSGKYQSAPSTAEELRSQRLKTALRSRQKLEWTYARQALGYAILSLGRSDEYLLLSITFSSLSRGHICIGEEVFYQSSNYAA